MKLIRAKTEDVQTLLEIDNTTRELKIYSGYFTKKEIEEWIKNDIVYLIKDNGIIVGSLSYEIKGDKNAYISGLVIKPEFQKRGLARRAMMQLFKELEKFDKLSLAVHPENHAVKLYKSLGFALESIKENYFGDGQPRMIMIRMGK